MQIEPLVAPTRVIMRQTSVTYTWHEFFPHGITRLSQTTSNRRLHLGLGHMFIDIDCELTAFYLVALQPAIILEHLSLFGLP